MNVGDVVQFNENHEWCGSLGIITETKDCKSEKAPGGDVRIMVEVPIPMKGPAYIYVMASEFALERIGKAILMQKESEY